MARITPKYKSKKVEGAETPLIVELLEKAEQHPTPDTFKLGREATLQLAKWERNLFTDQEERESGNYIVSGLPKKITDMDFNAFYFAVGQTLYNQSHQSGNTDTNTGLTKRVAKNISESSSHTYYNGEIVSSLKDLCRYGYGEEEPTTAQRKAMISLIDTIHETPVTITFPNGDTFEATLCARMGVYTRAKDGAKLYHLILNPIFCENVKKNFAEFPQNLTKRLAAVTKKRKPTHYRLIRLLGLQDKRKPFIRTMEVLLNELGLKEAYKSKAGRTEEELISIIEDIKKMKQITSYEVEKVSVRGKERISKITFYLNPNFVRKSRKKKPTPPEEN